MSKNHDEACYLFGEILERAFNLSALTNNYRYVEKALQYAGDQIVLDEVETYQQMSKNPAFAGFLIYLIFGRRRNEGTAIANASEELSQAHWKMFSHALRLPL